jgi:hypothetical protein
MPNAEEVVVTVTMNDGAPHCDKEWVHLYWRKKKTAIRWVFEGIPARWVSAGIEFLGAIPDKYADGTGGFLADPIFNGVAFQKASKRSQIHDIVTIGHRRREGYFCYNLMLYDGDGAVVTTDPGGSNDPDEPPTPVPGGGG